MTKSTLKPRAFALALASIVLLMNILYPGFWGIHYVFAWLYNRYS